MMTKKEFGEFCKGKTVIPFKPTALVGWKYYNSLPHIFCEFAPYGDYNYHYDAETETIFYTYSSIGD